MVTLVALNSKPTVIYLRSSVRQLRNNFDSLDESIQTLLAATGDGGSHFSFGAFPEADAIGRALNDASCRHALPTFPAESPFVLGVGGEQWEASPSPDGAPANGASASDPIYWYAGGSGFSRRFARPPYQDDAVAGYLTAAAAEGSLPPEDSFLAGNR